MCLIINLQRYSPNPLPCLKISSLVKRLKTYSCFSAGIPHPVSVMLTNNIFRLLSFRQLRLINPWVVNLLALFNKARSNRLKYCGCE